MRKFRKYTYIIIIALVTLVVTAALFAFIAPGRTTEIIFNIVALIVSTTSVALAIHSQIHAERSRHVDERVIRDLREINQTVEHDSAVDRSLRYKLDKIIAQNEIIYQKMGGDLDDFAEKTSSAAHKKQVEQRQKEVPKD